MRERLSEIVKILNLSHVKFSISLGRKPGWATALITKNPDSLKAKDILKIKEVHNINPLYILEGIKPVFLRGKNNE